MAANIKPKKKAVIQKGNGFSYNPLTFAEEHSLDIFHEADSAQEILDNVQPFYFIGRKFITFDTEANPYYKNSHELMKDVVRRWIGTGKKAVPIDYPFSIQVCDGRQAWCLYDTLENGFAKFKELAPLFENPDIEKIAHNTKFDMHMFQNAKCKIIGRLHDTVVLSKLANENRPDFSLVALAARAKHGIVKFEYMVDTYKQLNHVTDYRQIPRELLTQYGCADVWNCMQVFIKEYTSILEQDAGQDGVSLEDAYNNEMECMIALYAMERLGMRTDSAYEKELKDSLQDTVDAAEAAVYEMAGEVFNINSGMQVAKVMRKLGVDESVLRYTAAGNVCLDKNEMARLDEIYHIPIISRIQEYKKNEKLLTTYATGIYEQVDEVGNAHASMNQAEATTNRMSITKPALQTLPKKDKRIRRMFIPEDGYEMWFMDLDQIEYRLLAHYAKAAGLIKAINDGYDVHTATGALIFHKAIEDVTDDDRGRAKTVNFAQVYGQGNEATAEGLHITVSEAIAFKAQYFASMPEIKPFINTVHAVIKQRGFVKNFYGRRRRLDANDAYKAPNSLIQGCAAGYIKTKMVDMYKYQRYNNLKSTMTNIVHDELILLIHESERDQAPVLRWLMSDFDNFRCKITAGVECGNPSWGQKVTPEDIGFKEPEDKGYLQYNLFDGHVFDINMEVAA